MKIDENRERISLLVYRSIIGVIDPAEQQELEAWCQECEANRELYLKLTDARHLAKELARRKAIDTSRPRAEMEQRIGRRRSLRGGRIVRLAVSSVAAAAIICVVILTARPDKVTDELLNQSVAQVETVEIRHGRTQATLTTESGENIELSAADSVKSKQLIKQERIAVSKPVERKLSINVPRGGEFMVILEDSTHVWLNSCSKLVYPESFTKEERRVSITGEVYFEVAKDSRPFYVETEGQVVRVYGTEFNVRSYPEDPDIYTTLVSGSISLCRLDHESSELMLTPGKQALFNKTARYTTVKSVNPEVVTSWRDGRFVFEGQTLDQIMCDLGRWYAFDYEFRDESLRKIEFMGSIPRYSEFDTVLAILEMSGGLRFEQDGARVIISRK